MIFGMLNHEKMWREHLADLSISAVRYSHFTSGNQKKSFSTVLFIHSSDYLRCLVFGTQCIHTKTVSRPTHERMLACNWNNTNVVLAWISPGLRYALSALDPVPSGRGISSHRLPITQKRFVAHTALNGYRPTLWCRPTKRTQLIFKAALCSAPGRGSEIRHSR